MAAGAIASCALFFQPKASRKNIILYLFVRALQCWYNDSKSRGWFHFWGSSWKYGDSLLFALSSAQVMYAYIMRPETLPPSYYKFIVHSGYLFLPYFDLKIEKTRLFEFCKITCIFAIYLHYRTHHRRAFASHPDLPSRCSSKSYCCQ